jgi:hypothetical protein
MQDNTKPIIAGSLNGIGSGKQLIGFRIAPGENGKDFREG